jgi:hypothetical protein
VGGEEEEEEEERRNRKQQKKRRKRCNRCIGLCGGQGGAWAFLTARLTARLGCGRGPPADSLEGA